ncbi:MAG: hypothetical protein EOL93_07305 [Epsilonproteobacteria bacterium]|nr:hypothetical protein [Campylobacterota bacterium]
MAQSLGIKPGSAEFKALKAGHDMDSVSKKNIKNKKEGTEKPKTKKEDVDDFIEKGKGKGKNQ